MGTVVALEPFRREREALAGPSAPPEHPRITGADVWGRNYALTEDVVFGLLTVRRVGAWVMGGRNADFDSLCLDALEAAHEAEGASPLILRRAVAPLKEWLMDLAEDADEDARRDIAWAVIILDLIEKSPAARS